MKRSTAVLALAVVVGQLLLAAAVFDPSPHTGGDNAGYITLAYSLLERGAYLDLQDPAEPIHTKYPPIYPAVLAVGMAMGARTWAALKSFSAVFMTVALLMSFLWAARRRGARFALLVAAILAVSEAYLFHTRWILSDPLFLMLTWCSIWAFGRADEGAGGGAPSLDGGDGRGAAAEPRDAGIDPAGSTDRTTPWLVLAGATAILAFFTRSAGLPLVLAVGILLGLRGRWRLLAAFALAFAIPAMLWWLRAEAGPNYALEFWLVDPYRPDLGTAGPADLVNRVIDNVRTYVGRWIPGGLIGLRGGLVSGIGVVMFVIAGGGWWHRVRRRPGLAEVFAPLYLGLILLWPVVWAGDRFALPLYALVVFYAGEVVSDWIRGRAVGIQALAVAVATLPFLVPAGALVRVSAGEAAACRALVAAEGAFACYPATVREYVKAAEWSDEHLSGDARVLTRKPRLFFVLTGIQGRTVPLTRDASEFLDEALSFGATHAVMDYLDSLAGYYLAPVVEGRTGAFCSLVGFGTVSETRTEIFGILRPDQWDTVNEEPAVLEGGALMVSLDICPGSPPSGRGDSGPPYSGPEIPLLSRLDRPDGPGAGGV